MTFLFTVGSTGLRITRVRAFGVLAYITVWISFLAPAAFAVPQVSDDFQPLLMANGLFSGTPRVFTVPIDWSVRHAVFSIAAKAAVTLTVTRPNGTVVGAGSPGVTIRNFPTGALVAVDTPQPGAWTFSVSGTGEYSVAVSGDTPLSIGEFNFVDHVTIKHAGFFRIQGQPLSGLPATALGRIEGTVVPVTFEAISSDGVTLGTFALSLGHPDAADGDYTGTVNLPNQPFRVIARGVDSGFPFQRIVPTLFRAQPVSVFPDTVPDAVIPGTEAIVRFFVRNVGPAATFTLAARDDRGFVTSVSPQTIALQQDEIGTVQVTLFAPLNAAIDSPSTTGLKVSAAVQGQPSLENSAFVELDVISVPPATAGAP